MNREWRERLAAFDDEDLDPRERSALELLIDSDIEARSYLTQLRVDRSRMREAFSQITARPGFTEGVMARVEAQRSWWQVLTPRWLEVCAVALMALVMVSMTGAGGHDGKHIACLDNLRGLSRGLLAYAQDYDGRLPDSSSWLRQVEQHHNTTYKAQCPADERDAVDGTRVVSYGMPHGLSGASLRDVPNPGSQISLFDGVGPFLQPRHNAAANVAYVDGHVATYHPPGR